MQSQPTSYNRVGSSTQPLLNKKQQNRKSSQQQINRPVKQSLKTINQGIETDINKFQSVRQLNQTQKSVNQNLMKKTSIGRKQTINYISSPKIMQGSHSQRQTNAQKFEQGQKRDYLSNKITPVLSKMLVKIVNQKPVNLLDFMIQYLKKEQQKYQTKRFNSKANNDIMSEQKHFEEVFDSTVATKFLKFKK